MYLFVFLFKCVCLHVCICVDARVYRYSLCICVAYMPACMSMCRLVVDVKHLPSILSFSFSFEGSVSQSRPVKLTDTAITSKIVLAILYPFFLRLEFQGGPLCSPAVHSGFEDPNSSSFACRARFRATQPVPALSFKEMQSQGGILFTEVLHLTFTGFKEMN